MKMLLGHDWVDRPETMDVVDPYDGTIIESVPRATKDDMTLAIDVAVKAFHAHRSSPAVSRMTVLDRVHAAMQLRINSFAHTIAREGIKTINEAEKEVLRCIQTIRIAADEARRFCGEMIPFDQAPGGERRQGYFKRLPLGVIGAITPFNDPLNLVAHKIAPALAVGNAVIVKPHEATPLSALMLAQLFVEAGLPPGLLQVVTGEGAVVGDTLVRDPRVAMISFTGGRHVGEAIAGRAGVKKLAMELGGNAPVIVMPDADMGAALEACVSGAYWAAGQNCVHVQRILIHESCYADFVDHFVARVKEIRTGNKQNPNTQMGPMIHMDAVSTIMTKLESALANGARILCGGNHKGTVMEPTVIEGIDPLHPLAYDEVFGPVTSLFSFKTQEEAIQLANTSPYGLHAGIFTRDLQAAFQMADAIDCGGVMINESSDYRIDAMPFGGTKGSGLGREGVRFAMEAMSEPKVYCFNF